MEVSIINGSKAVSLKPSCDTILHLDHDDTNTALDVYLILTFTFRSYDRICYTYTILTIYMYIMIDAVCDITVTMSWCVLESASAANKKSGIIAAANVLLSFSYKNTSPRVKPGLELKVKSRFWTHYLLTFHPSTNTDCWFEV